MATASLFDEAPESVDVRPVFFALYPDAATVERLMALWQQLRHRLGLTSNCIKNFHVTLFLVGPHVALVLHEG